MVTFPSGTQHLSKQALTLPCAQSQAGRCHQDITHIGYATMPNK